MNKAEIDKIAAQLQELRAIHDLYGPEGSALRRDLARLAREDLYLANRLFDSHVPLTLREQPGAKPVTLRAAALIERHFEGRARDERPPVQIYGEADAVVTRPASGRSYDGKVVGRTPDYVVQKVENDYVLHRHASLTIDPGRLHDDVSIRYPFSGPHAVGLVRERSAEHQQQQELVKTPLHKDLGLTFEREFSR
ncbi:KfrB domain-containing protein [Castellaniella sp. UC4442_H9]